MFVAHRDKLSLIQDQKGFNVVASEFEPQDQARS